MAPISRFALSNILLSVLLRYLLAGFTTSTAFSFERRPRNEVVCCSAEDLPRATTTITRRRTLLDITATAPLLFYPTSPCSALTPSQAESRYDSYASSYDQLDGGDLSSKLGIDQARREMVKEARGHVLEVGVGTGLNLASYDPSKVSKLTLVDVSDGMLKEARERVRSLENLRNVSVSVVKADATADLVSLFGQDAFDTVVDSFSLCVMGNDGARRCLIQMSSVVKKASDGGQVLLLENSRSSNPLLAAYQDATAETAATAGGKGCLYNQDVSRLIEGTGRLRIHKEVQYAAGLFRCFYCERSDD